MKNKNKLYDQEDSNQAEKGKVPAEKEQVEATKIKNDYHKVHQYSNYNMTYSQFMQNIYLSIYKGNVEQSTWESKKSVFKIIGDRFANQKLREITVEDAELFRVYLLNESGYSKGFSSMVYSSFRRTLTKAVNL